MTTINIQLKTRCVSSQNDNDTYTMRVVGDAPDGTHMDISITSPTLLFATDEEHSVTISGT